MNDGLGFYPVVMLFLDDRSPVDRFPLLDDCGTVAIRGPDRNRDGPRQRSGPDRSDANTDLFGHRRDGERADCRGDKQ
jgi:hypothetical protein